MESQDGPTNENKLLIKKTFIFNKANRQGRYIKVIEGPTNISSLANLMTTLFLRNKSHKNENLSESEGHNSAML